MGKQVHFFVGQDRKPSDLVRRRLTEEPARREGLLALLGELSLDAAYEAFDESPEEETDKLTSSLHDYLIALLRSEYSRPPSGLEYNMSMANRYIIGFEVDEAGCDPTELDYQLCRDACQQAAEDLGVGRQDIKLYALNW
jgi:hypothetical protein